MWALLILAALFGGGAASAQQIIDYPAAPNIKTLRVGAIECTLWRTNTSVQIACCDNACAGVYSGTLTSNQIMDVSKSNIVGGYGEAAIGRIVWVLYAGSSAGTVNFQICVNATDGSGPPPEIGVFQ